MTTPAKPDLKPCPFCGGSVDLEQTVDGTKFWGVVCRSNKNLGGTCAIQQIPSRTQGAAVTRWNTRADPPPQAVPDNWPTEEMIKAGVHHALHSGIGGDYLWPDYVRDLFKKMLSAAPPPQNRAAGDDAEALKAFDEYCSALFYISIDQAYHRLRGERHESGPTATMQKIKDRASKAYKVLEPHIEIIRARLQSPQQGGAWKDIETAPRDGTDIIGLVDGRRTIIIWGKAPHVPLYGWIDLTTSGDPEDRDLCEPTDWQPLPPAPSQDAQEG